MKCCKKRKRLSLSLLLNFWEPKESDGFILLHILRYLSPREMLILRNCSKRWKVYISKHCEDYWKTEWNMVQKYDRPLLPFKDNVYMMQLARDFPKKHLALSLSRSNCHSCKSPSLCNHVFLNVPMHVLKYRSSFIKIWRYHEILNSSINVGVVVGRRNAFQEIFINETKRMKKYLAENLRSYLESLSGRSLLNFQTAPFLIYQSQQINTRM